MRVRIFQATSATAVPVSERPWKELRVLPRQTILESASLDFPLVKAETIFLVRWLNGAHRITGTVEVLVYPTNLLHEVKLMVGESWNNLGVLDPKNQIKPALKNAMIGFVDLAETELDAFSGTLAIVGSCSPEDPEWNGLADRISKLARHGTPVVWIQGPSRRRDKIQPSFYAVPQNRAAVIVIQPELILDLPENPQSQVNLIYFFRLALNPQPLMRPDLPPHP
jgi:hypothetical protein